MSGPYRLPPERVTSPLDQRPVNHFPSGQPNFKANVNRNKTRKWVEAKPYSYDGDDWGDYDEDDEYGVSSHASQAPQAPTGLRQRGQSIEKGSRSFTEPHKTLDRRNSFEYGDDKRAFSSGGPLDLPPIDTSCQGESGAEKQPKSSVSSPSPQQCAAREVESAQSRGSILSWGAASTKSDSSAFQDPQTRRDFERSALPQPLQMRATAPTSAPDAPLGGRPRTGSLAPETTVPSASHKDSAPMAERQRAPSNPNKPLPFVRPADIYKRAVEGRQNTPEVGGASGARSPGVEEKTRHEHLPGFELTKPPGQPTSGFGSGVTSPSFPQLHSGSTFGNDSLDSTQQNNARETDSGAAQGTAGAELQHQPSTGFRSAVRAAFERKDDNSVPPTPISKSNSLSASGCNVSRSNTDSTAGISPIMSGVPGGGLPSLRTDTSTPAIAEEPSPSPRSASGTIQPFDPSPKPSTSTHSRNPSGGTLPGVSSPTARPNSNHSPARSPAIEPARPVAAPASAEMSADYGVREADLASPSSKSSSSRFNSGLEELAAQVNFLDSHRTPGPESPVSRAESPSKGRVRDLAGKLNEKIADSRRNSTQSTTSQKSNDSKKSSLPPSPTKVGVSQRPHAEREISFRPKIPGTWESYSTTPGQMSPEKEMPEPPVKMSRETTASSFDLGPTTAKRQLDYKEPVDLIKNPTGALAATSAALGESIRSAFSPGERSAVSSSEDVTEADDDRVPRAVGDVWLRPLHVDRSATSTTAETDMTSQSRDACWDDSPVDAPAPLRSSRSPSTQPEARTPLPRSRTIKDVGSEALEQEIMKRLSDPSLGRLSVEPHNRTGSGLSKELDNNWTSGGEDDVQSLHTGLSVHGATTIRPVEASPFSSPERDDPRPSGFLTKRFSWENSSAGNGTPTHQTPSKLLGSIDNPGDSVGRLQLVNPEPELSPSPEPVELEAPAAPNQPLDADVWRAQSTAVDPAATLGERSTSLSQTLTSSGAGEQSRVPLFREILALKSSHERISKFNQTRESFASMDTGLRAWVAMTLDRKPEHAELATLPSNPPKSMSINSGSIRGHKHGPSLSQIATGLRKTSQTANPESALTGPSGAGGAAGSSASGSGANREKMQAKGKDLLKGAGVLGGKGMKEAKGLFAKGRSRFGRGESKALRNADNAPNTITTAAPASVVGSRKSSIFSTSAVPSRPVSSHTPLPPAVGNSDALADNGQSSTLSPVGDVATPPSNDDAHKQDQKKRKRFSAAISRITNGRSGGQPISMAAEVPTSDKGKRVASPLPPVEDMQVRPCSVALEGLAQEPIADRHAEEIQDAAENVDGAEKGRGKRPVAEPEMGLDSVLNGDPKPPAASPSPLEADRSRSLSSMDSEEDPFARIPSRPISHRDRSRSRAASALTSPSASRPVSGGAFVPPEEWDILPTLWTSGHATPGGERTPQTDRHMLPSQRSLERLRRNSSPQVLQNLRSSSLLSHKRSLAELPETPEREPSDQLIERLGVLPSPSIEPMNWPEEKQRRKAAGADQRLERVVESVVRHSVSLISRELKSEEIVKKVSKIREEDDGATTDTPTLQPRFQDDKMAGTQSGALSSRPSFVRDKRSTPSLRGTTSRASIRTRGSKASISSLLPIPLDEVARRSLAREEGQRADADADVAEVSTNGKAAEESVKKLVETREPDKTVQQKCVSPVRSVNSSGPDTSAGAPLSPGLSFHTAASHEEGLLELQPENETVDKEPALFPVVQKQAIVSPPPLMDEQLPREVSAFGPSPQPGQGEWLVPRTRKQRNDPRQGSHGITSPVTGLVDASHIRSQKSASGAIEHRALQSEPPMPQRFMSPPPGMVEYGSQQGRRGAPQAFQPFAEDRSSTTQEIAKEFDPRAYTPEFTLPGVGPPDMSRSDTRRKSFLGVGIPGSKHSTPLSGPSVERINERINPRDLDLGQRKFSYQSSNDERERDVPSEPPVRRSSRVFSPFRRTSVANDTLAESRGTSRSGSALGVASVAPRATAGSTPMSGPSVGPSPNKKGRNVLRRNHSVAVTPSLTEKKDKTKRRGSILGSIFGRSASTTQAKEKGEKKSRRAEGKRLSKMPAVTETRLIDEISSDAVRPSQGQPFADVPEIPLHLQKSGESTSRIYHKEPPSVPNVNPSDLHCHKGFKTPPPPPQSYYIPSGPDYEDETLLDAPDACQPAARSRYYQPQGPPTETTLPRPQPPGVLNQYASVNGLTVPPTQPYMARQNSYPELNGFAGMHASPPGGRIASPPNREWSRSRGPDPALPMVSYMPSRPSSANAMAYSGQQSKTPPNQRHDPFTAQRIFYEQQRQHQADQETASMNDSTREATHYMPGPPMHGDQSNMQHYAPTPSEHPSNNHYYAPTPPLPGAPPQQQQQQRPYQLTLPPNPKIDTNTRSIPRFDPDNYQPASTARPEPRWREASLQEAQQFQQKQMQASRLPNGEASFYAPARPTSRGGPMSWAADPYHRRGSAPPIAYAPPPPHNSLPTPQMHLPPPARNYTGQAIHQMYGNGYPQPQQRRRSSSGQRPSPDAYVPHRGSAVYDFPNDEDDDSHFNDEGFGDKRNSRGRRWRGFANAEAQAQAEAYDEARLSAVRAQSRSRSRSISLSRGSRSRSRGRVMASGGRARGLSQTKGESSFGPEERKSSGQSDEPPLRMLGSSYPGMEWHPGVG